MQVLACVVQGAGVIRDEWWLECVHNTGTWDASRGYIQVQNGYEGYLSRCTYRYTCRCTRNGPDSSTHVFKSRLPGNSCLTATPSERDAIAEGTLNGPAKEIILAA